MYTEQLSDHMSKLEMELTNQVNQQQHGQHQMKQMDQMEHGVEHGMDPNFDSDLEADIEDLDEETVSNVIGDFKHQDLEHIEHETYSKQRDQFQSPSPERIKRQIPISVMTTPPSQKIKSRRPIRDIPNNDDRNNGGNGSNGNVKSKRSDSGLRAKSRSKSPGMSPMNFKQSLVSAGSVYVHPSSGKKMSEESFKMLQQMQSDLEDLRRQAKDKQFQQQLETVQRRLSDRVMS